MKKLAELTTTEFVDLLASDAPAPGGGSAAALEGALGAALSAMVCGLTTVGKSKEKYADYQEFVIESQKKLTELKVAFVDVMDRDTEAFNVVSAAFGMPKATDEEKAARRAAANYTLAVPQFYGGRIQLLLPLCLTGDKPELALTIQREDGFYAARTCLTLDMAYNNARLICRPEASWIKR